LTTFLFCDSLLLPSFSSPTVSSGDEAGAGRCANNAHRDIGLVRVAPGPMVERREAQPVPLNRRVLSQSTLGGPDRKGLRHLGASQAPWRLPRLH